MQIDNLWFIPVCFFAVLFLRSAKSPFRVAAPQVFWLVFTVTLPALVFINVSGAMLEERDTLLPVIGFGICSISAIGSALYSRICRLPRDKTNSLILGASIVNLLFTYPFVVVILGNEALTMMILLDIGNAVFVATVANWVAVGNLANPALRILKTPLFIGVTLALVANIAGVKMPALVYGVLGPLGGLTMPLTMLGLGLSFNVSAFRQDLPIAPVLLRMGLGLLIGLPVAWVLAEDGTTAAIIICAATAPVGFSAATFASIGNLDTEKMTLAISLSALVGFVTVPAVLWLFPGLI